MTKPYRGWTLSIRPSWWSRQVMRLRRTSITTMCVTAMVLAVVAAACAERAAPQETVESLRAASPTLRNKAQLRIAVRNNAPLMSYWDPKTGELSGFEIEIAKAIASDLGYSQDRIEWVTATTVPDRLAALQANRADLVVANLSMTKERDELVDFAGPYLLVPQAIMVRRDRTRRPETIADLRASNMRICTGIGSTSEKALVAKGITPEPVDTATICLDGLKSGRYDAASFDLSVLAGFLTMGDAGILEILPIAIADFSERIGIAVPNGDAALRDLAAYFLYRWQKGPPSVNPWLGAYDRTIGPYLDRKYRSQPLVDDPPVLADFDSKAPQG